MTLITGRTLKHWLRNPLHLRISNFLKGLNNHGFLGLIGLTKLPPLEADNSAVSISGGDNQ